MILYVLAMVKPIFPVFEYALNYHHFKNVLCENRELPDLKCNGTCVLAKRIEAAKSLSLPPFAPRTSNSTSRNTLFRLLKVKT